MSRTGHFALRFNSLVIETTSRCNAKCAMCYQSSGPKGHDEFGIRSLKTKVIKRAISDAYKVPNLIKKLHVAGGEAFLNEKQVFEVLGHAKDVGYEDISMTTNAYWGHTEKRAVANCERLCANGVTTLEISWDYWHTEYIDARRVTRVLKAAKQCGLGTILRVLTTRKHSLEEALDLLGDGWLYVDRVISGKVFASGRATRELDPDEFYLDPLSDTDACHSILNLVINAKGDVFPCCAGIDQTENPQLGNVYKTPIDKIARNMTNNLWLRKLVFDGVLSLEKLVEEKDHDYERVKDGSMCSRCWSLFDDQGATDIVKDHGRELGRAVLRKALTAAADATP